MGRYCSYCERPISTQLAVEHVQPKGLPRYAGLKGRWDNFLLSCANCNSTKKDKDVALTEVLLPDRDNTHAAYVYPADGRVEVATSAEGVRAQASATLSLVGLDKRISEVRDENGKLVAMDRASQRLEAHGVAEAAREIVARNPDSDDVRQLVVQNALATGFFSIWMAVFAEDVDMRRRLVSAFPGTRDSLCFHPDTFQLVSPAPNPDGLPGGSKI